MCICDDKDLGDEVILKSVESPFFLDATAFLDLAICRTDKWAARIDAWVTMGGKRTQLLIASVPINYCPRCGRRLSLRDAGREDE